MTDHQNRASPCPVRLSLGLLLVVCAALALLACDRGEPISPEEQVRAAISEMADAARAGDSAAVLALVHADYTDDETGSKFVFGRVVESRLAEGGVGVTYDITDLTTQPDETVSAVVEARFRGAEGRSGLVVVHSRWVPDDDGYTLASSQVDRHMGD